MLKHNKMMVEITLKVILCKTISQITTLIPQHYYKIFFLST